MFDRRCFFQALGAAAVAAGVPLPVGLPREVVSRIRIMAGPWVHEWRLYADGTVEGSGLEAERVWLWADERIVGRCHGCARSGIVPRTFL